MAQVKRTRRFRIASATCLVGALVVLVLVAFGGDWGLPPGGLPYGLSAIFILVMCAIGFQIEYRIEKRRERRKGKPCVQCGYDLRGNTSGICPECGGLAHYRRSRP